MLCVIFSQCYFDYPSLVRTAEDTSSNTWGEWEQHPYLLDSFPSYNYTDWHTIEMASEMNGPILSTCQMYMFPIFAETDSTLGDGINFDTNDTTDMCIYDVNVDRFSSVSPNPASDVITAQSSFKIKEIEIHNSLGQMVLRKETNQNIETIDVSNLQSGMYIVKVKTKRGFTTKKVVIK